MSDLKISRRALVASAGIASAGITSSATAQSADSIDWFEGRLLAVSAAGDARALCGVRGHTAVQRGYRNATGWYYDLADKHRIQSMTNPLTGSLVKPAGFTFETESRVTPTAEGWFVSFEEMARVTISGVTGLSTMRRAVHIADMQNNAHTAGPVTGHWSFVGPWLPWLEMGEAFGHCQFDCRIGGGVARVSDLPLRFHNAAYSQV